MGTKAVALSAGLSQMLLMSGFLLAAFLYDPSDVAKFQWLFSAALILAPMATGAAEIRIPVSADASEARKYFSGSLRATVFAAATGVVATAVVAFWNVELAGFLCATVAASFLVAIGSIEQGWLTRELNYRALAVRNLMPGLSFAICTPLLSTAPNSSFLSLSGAFVVSRALPLMLFRSSLPRKQLMAQPGSRVWGVWGIGILMGNLAVQVPIISTGFLMSASEAASLTLALRFASLPASLLGPALAQSLVIAMTRSADWLTTGLARRGGQLAVVSLLLAGVAILSGQVLVRFLPAQYRDLGLYLAIMAIPSSLQLGARVLMPVFAAYNKERTLLQIQVARVAVLLALIVICLSVAPSPGGFAVALAAVSTLGLLFLYRGIAIAVRRPPS